MNDQLVSLSKIFTERLFRIPDYQRGYSWSIKEVTDFYNDLIRLKDEKSHYVGVLTLEPARPSIYTSWLDDLWLIKSRNYQPYYVVDGQQRLTTSSIFLITLLEEAKKRNFDELNFTPLKDIEKQFLYIEKQDTRSKSYLFSYELNNPSYDFLLTKIFMQKSEIDTSFDETSYTKNLEVAKQFFIDKLKDLSDEQINNLFYKVTQNFKFNIYEINSDIDVFITFETMNNRGKPLSHLELLKNRLIYISTLLKDDPEVILRLRRDINACWRDIYHYLGRDRERLLPDDEFLSSHFYLYFNKEIESDSEFSKVRFRSRVMLDNRFQQYYLLEKVFIPENVEKGNLGANEILDYTASLKSAITVWNAINNPLYSEYRNEIKKHLVQIM